MLEFILVVGGFAFVAIVATIGMWRTGDLRKAADKIPELDRKLEKLADLYDKIYKELKPQ